MSAIQNHLIATVEARDLIEQDYPALQKIRAAVDLGEKLHEPGPGKPARAFRVSNGLSLKTRSITQTAAGEAGVWTTTVAAAVLVC